VSSKLNSTLNYRPDIDGLRAIAVVAVILYHAQITIFGSQPFKGGFIGVDIFFVISGYLITLIILKELDTTGKFSFKHFYERRIRRILPMLLIVVLSTSFMSSIFLMPTLVEDVQKQSLSSIFFISNFKFIFDLTEYQAITSSYIPLLHTWSLSIEEQFYLIFPTFLFLIHKYFNQQIIFILLIVLMLSLIFSDWQSNHHKIENFYFSFSRAWELIFGSLCAFIKNKKVSFSKDYILLNNFGFLLIILSFYIFDATVRHPSIYTLIPVIGTCFIIIFNPNNYEFTIASKILSNKFLVHLGLISFSLYLWHYPFLVFLKSFEISENYKYLCLFLIYLLSVCSYKFIEKPFRSSINFNKVLIFLFSIIFFTVSLNLYEKGNIEKFVYKKNYLDNGYLKKEVDKYYSEIQNTKFNKDKKKVLIFGDSHATDLFIGLHLNNDLYNKYDFKHINASTSCLYDYFITDKLCGKISKIEISLLNNFDTIILKESWSPSEVNHLGDNLSFLKERFPNKNIIVIGNGPSFSTTKYKGVTSTYFDENINFNLNINDLEMEKKYFQSYITNKSSLELNNKVNLITKKFNVPFLNHAELICEVSQKKCKFLTNEGIKIFWDYGHYTIDGAKFLGKKIIDLNWLNLD
jgi:peptidoglycan/LPS O-acetylase OafA/YrhL